MTSRSAPTVSTPRSGRRFFPRAMAGGGRPLLRLVGLALVGSGVCALFLAGTGRFLPPDEHFLGMTAAELCALHGCRIVHFMIHDRVSFGGALIALGLVYLWLVEVPLRQGRAWAWWTFGLTGAIGFGSFLSYLGYGYLDTWHGVATLGLLPGFVAGLALSHATLEGPRGIRSVLVPRRSSPAGLGRTCLLLTALGMAAGGLVILAVGTTRVFVPQDLDYLGLSVDQMDALNPRLVPLIAHDRAGFGGAVGCYGLALLACAWCGTPSRGLWRVLAASGTVGFAAAIGVHPAIGYSDPVHLAPAVLGACLFAAGLLAYRRECFGRTPPAEVPRRSGHVAA